MVGLAGDKADAYTVAAFSAASSSVVALAAPSSPGQKFCCCMSRWRHCCQSAKSLQVEFSRQSRSSTRTFTTIFVTTVPRMKAMVMYRPHLPAECGNDREMVYPTPPPLPFTPTPCTKFAGGLFGSYNVLEPLEFGRVTGACACPRCHLPFGTRRRC